MRRLNTALLILATISTAAVIAAPSSSASDGPVNIEYVQTQDLDVTVPKTIPSGGTLTIYAYSERYDLGEAGIMLYTFGPDGKPDYTTSGRPPSAPRALLDDGSYRFIFYNVTEDVEVSFTQPLPLKETVGKEPGAEEPEIISSDDTFAAAIMLASIAGGAVMLVLMIRSLRTFGRPSNDPEGTP